MRTPGKAVGVCDVTSGGLLASWFRSRWTIQAFSYLMRCVPLGFANEQLLGSNSS